MTHAERISQTVAAFEAAMDRFLGRLESLSDAEAERPGVEGGWSPAQIAWHVAATNEGFAGLVDGSRPLARVPEADFVETPFPDIQARVPDRLEAPEMFTPPDSVSRVDALSRARESRSRFATAYRGLDETRAHMTIKSILGLLTVYQVGDWAVAHVARHNAQVKRAIGQ